MNAITAGPTVMNYFHVGHFGGVRWGQGADHGGPACKPAITARAAT